MIVVGNGKQLKLNACMFYAPVVCCESPYEKDSQHLVLLPLRALLGYAVKMILILIQTLAEIIR